ncbi:MAG: PQQ-binding-like beta-propeller repeat protein [Schlesneria sp.]
MTFLASLSNQRCFLFLACLYSLSWSTAFAAPLQGTIEEVSTEEKSVTVKLNGKNEESRTFNLAPKAVITINGKKADLSDIEEGQTVTVVVNAADLATKLTVKTAKNSPVKKSSPRPLMEDKSPDTDPSESAFWPQHRGPNRDNISKETGLLDSWPNGGPKLTWEQKGLGEGFSSVSIAHGKLYTMGNQGNDEMLLAMDAANGRPLWSTKTGGRAYREGQGNGPRGTPTVDDDRVYALGANGDLICVGANKGEVVWQKNILNDYGGNNIQWGISESVLIDGQNLICSPGGKRATMAAIDKMTGREVWTCIVQEAPAAAYSSPIVVDYQGERMYVNFVHTAVVAVRAKDGNVLWGHTQSANGTANCSTPVSSDGLVFTASGYDTGCALFKLAKGGKAKLEYANKEMKNHHGGMVVVDGYLYGFDEQILKCLDLKTGKVQWKDRSVGKGSLTYADGHLYLRSEAGPVALCVASNKRYEEKGRFNPAGRSDKPAWSHPVVCDGRLFLRDMDSIAVYEIKN